MDRKQTWSLSDHRNLYGKNFNGGLANWVIDNLKFNSLLEFGCGAGHYCKYWSDKGIKYIHGIEPEPMDEKNFKNKECEQFCFDITQQDEPSDLLSEYDVIFTLEVLEHIDFKFHDKVFDFFASKNPKTIVFSAARIGQRGHGHIACRSKEDWAKQLTDRGYNLDVDQTNDILSSSDKKNVNHRINLQVFHKLTK